MREKTRLGLAFASVIVVLVSSGASRGSGSAESPAAGPASGVDVCPAIDAGFELCAGDPWSGSCAQFVAAAGRLAQLYQIQVAESPANAPTLLATNG